MHGNVKEICSHSAIIVDMEFAVSKSLYYGLVFSKITKC